MTEIDLETGKKTGDSARDRERARKSGGGGTSKPSTTTARREPGDTRDLKSSLIDTFEALADAFETRGDQVLAEIFSEEKEVMARGLVDLTRGVTVLRPPLVILLAFVRPMLAFGRLGRELLGRWSDRRARRIAEWEAQQPEQPEQPLVA